jgi:predicted extracellular nuclease
MRPPTGRRLSTPVRRQLLGLLLVFSLTLLALPHSELFIPTAEAAAPTELFFSEYVEGSSTNKALEIYNGTGAPVTLTGQYSVQMFFNGSSTAGLTINLTGTIANGDVFLLVNQTAGTNPFLTAIADQTNGSGWFNGDDAVVLRKGATIVDVIGQIGNDPGTEWGSGLTSTADNTLRRKAAVMAGDAVGTDPFVPSAEWDGFAQDAFDGLGGHPDSPPGVSATTPASGAVNVGLGSNITVTFSEPVNAAGSWFSISCNLSGPHAATVSGGPTTFTLDPTTNFAVGETCTLTVLASQVTDQDGGDPPDTMMVNFQSSFNTITVDPCTSSVTPIHVIQGSGNASLLAGSNVTLRGVVTGDFQGGSGLNGFFVQEQTGDGDPATSDGVFVFVPSSNALSSVDVAAGDLVAVSGRVTEFNTLTEIDNVSAISVCGLAGVPAPAVVNLPESVNGELERYEGMLVTLPQTLTAQQNFFQGRFGQVTLASGGRLFNPTNIFLPGSPEAVNQADENARRLIVLDDGSGAQNPNPIPYIGADNTLRAGDTVAGLRGVIDFGPINSNTSIRDYRLHPTVALTFTRENPRTAAPDAVGGNVRLASFNVLNYFNGNGTGQEGAAGGFPTSRGASTLAEFNRQRDKTIAALTAINADVVGLIEIENDGAGAASAIQDLVNGLNAANGAGTYAPIVGPSPGTDEIQVAFIYKPSRVTPVGAPVNDVNAVYERQPLAQTFAYNANGQRFTAIVNHFKSKSGCPSNPSDPDADQGDGQGCFNARRVLQAQQLLGFISGLQSATGDDDVLVMGDLNAYGKEDPVTTLTSGGLADMIAAHVEGPYSFIFDGMSGYLDHALATGSLSAQVSGVTEWHINADEPSVIDYNTEFKPQDLYAPTPYRSADHDPVIVGLNLRFGVVALYDQAKAHNAGSTIPVRIQITDADGNNLSSPGTVVKALGISQDDDAEVGELSPAPSTANPDSNFRFDASLGGTGGYIYNLRTQGLSAGTYYLYFTVGSDPALHTVAFQIR